MQRRVDWTLIGLSVGLVFLLGLGGISLFTYFSLNSGQNDAFELTWQEPWSVVDGAHVPPDLGLLPLAGDSVDATVRRALNANELDAGYALTVQSPELTDAQRAGHLLLLGKRYMAAQQPGRASLCFRLAHVPLHSPAVGNDAVGTARGRLRARPGLPGAHRGSWRGA